MKISHRFYFKASIAFQISLSLIGFSSMTHASSHREAPFITQSPKVDGTDFYMFRSYESGRSGFVTLIVSAP